MSSNVEMYLKLLQTNMAPSDEKQVKLYVDNLLEGLAVDIDKRMRANSRDKAVCKLVVKEIQSRYSKLRF